MFQWQSHIWLPLFQCKRLDLAPDARLHPMFAELILVYDR